MSEGWSECGRFERALSVEQRDMVTNLESRLMASSRPGVPSDVPGGGHLSLVTLLNLLSASPYNSHGKLQSTSGTIAVVIFSAPATASVIPLASVLPPTFARLVSTPGAFDLPCDEVPAELPATCWDVDCWPAVAAAMWDRDMIRLSSPTQPKPRGLLSDGSRAPPFERAHPLHVLEALQQFP